jgi:hypothetical protein
MATQTDKQDGGDPSSAKKETAGDTGQKVSASSAGEPGGFYEEIEVEIIELDSDREDQEDQPGMRAEPAERAQPEGGYQASADDTSAPDERAPGKGADDDSRTPKGSLR